MKVKNINFFIELDRFSIFMFKIDPIQIEKNVLCMVMYLKIRVLDIYCLFFFKRQEDYLQVINLNLYFEVRYELYIECDI